MENDTTDTLTRAIGSGRTKPEPETRRRRGAYWRSSGDQVLQAQASQSPHSRDVAGCPRLALAIRQARRKARLTQAELAEMIGVGRPMLAHLEGARKPVNEAQFKKLSEALRGGPYDWQAVEEAVELRWGRSWISQVVRLPEAENGR